MAHSADVDAGQSGPVETMLASDAATRMLGIELLEYGDGWARTALTVRDDMVNGHGMCHGGIVFAFADSAFAFACNSHGDPMVAAGASIEFLAPTPRGERVIATAAEVSRSARHGIYDVAVADVSGTVLAQFRGRCSRFRGANQS